MKKTKKRGRPTKKICLMQDGKLAMHFETIDELAEFVGKSKNTIYKYICRGIPVQRATPLCKSEWFAKWNE